MKFYFFKLFLSKNSFVILIFYFWLLHKLFFCFRSSRKFKFQCTSVTYYHKDRDCVLNLANRQISPQVFVENPMQHETNSQITYAGLICDPVKAIGMHVKKELENGCQRIPENNSELENVIQTTTCKVFLFIILIKINNIF